MRSKGHKRKFTRIPLYRMVGVIFPENTLSILPTRDLSLAGMYLETNVSHPVETACTIHLAEYLTGSRSFIEVNGRIVRTDDQGLAIAYTGMNEKSFELLQTILLYKSNNPLTVGEEFTQQCPFSVKN